jgi:hypothetical protein
VYGTDGKAPNIIERNVIWNSGDHGIQAAAEAIIRNNVLFRNRADGIYSRRHQSAVVGNLQIVHNTVFSSRPGGAAIRVVLGGGERLSGPVLLANNALYSSPSGFALRIPSAELQDGSITLAGNVGAGPAEGLPADIARDQWNPSGDLDRDLDESWYPRRDSRLIGAATARFAVADDFNQTPRGKTRDVGAYIFDRTGNPGWKLTTGFKDLR